MQIAFKQRMSGSNCPRLWIEGRVNILSSGARPIIIAPLVTLHLLSSRKWGYCWPRNDLHSWHFHSQAASDIELGTLVQLLDERCHVHCHQRDFASLPSYRRHAFYIFFTKALPFRLTNCLLCIGVGPIEKGDWSFGNFQNLRWRVHLVSLVLLNTKRIQRMCNLPLNLRTNVNAKRQRERIARNMLSHIFYVI